ncbi:anhydro-N-acetylmuramic acid kinase [Paracoccus sp. (in: a-proteobacteria)]|uniref:anhydro-N-acetylmuramic acid kinase n=1 Tax=Paracoccus sp. TaxID=267 RepID=UPI0026DF64B7|nr:anhydro-N-acetylmuramic acid kinase [Paracoccus sp. (in: a-proteobacteria)]MDO5648944.1 anhydro-N-acetylmuramic acid kinase [Paracoccus sp. (in: a-proteobacteria)]
MIRALGMMSGTSLDGVDAALIDTDGVRIGGFGSSGFLGFDAQQVAALRGALGAWPGEARVADAAAVTLATHAALARDFPDAQVIGFHGQTLAHDPGGRGTHQAGDGAALARATARPVIWDFRSEDVRRGGQGAPLVPFFHWALADWAAGQGLIDRAPVAFLNLGGVGNISWVDPRADAPDAPGACVAFDTGPANAPINDLMLARRGVARDDGGAVAAAGRADPGVIAAFRRNPYFAKQPPKSLDRDHWAGLSAAVANLPDADAAATLVAAVAESVAAGFDWLPDAPARVLVCGGGRHNATIMAALRARLSSAVDPVEAIHLNGDMIEAQAFAWLAVRVLRGLPVSGPMTTGVPGPCCGGRISYP